ncbi:MAG: DUF6471 domain-containing protein [Pseudomonadota bacterium]
MILPIIVKDENIEYDDVSIDSDEDTMKDQWSEHAKGLLKAELKRRNVSYRDLAERLTAMGTPESERNLANKISRGGFPASFLLQCLRAIGCDDVRIDHMPKPVESVE